ncbi:MAG: O-antigen ligase family protein [Acaryochloridaceae cyanobacterium SU_2_1]|nr:O-antigen ligase family protein [Acaryochloridaceae cyanobacterium SU_2_1]
MFWPSVKTSSLQPKNLPESLVWFYITGTYGVYLLGAQFFFAILLALFLIFYVMYEWWNFRDFSLTNSQLSLATSLWVLSMLLIGIAIVIGHLDFGHNLIVVAKTSLKWIPFALFPVIGHFANIRPQIIFRSACFLCLQSLVLMPILYLAILFHLPSTLYTSPLKILGGDVSRYMVNLYVMDVQELRLALFAPHCPALGLTGNIYFCLCRQEKVKNWRYIGMIGATAMVIASVSRAAIISLPIVIGLEWFLNNILSSWVYYFLGLVSVTAGIVMTNIVNLFQDLKAQLVAFRSNSSRVRSIIEEISLQRWSEAPLWGHGLIEAGGPEITGNMAIGTHHTWFGMLFTQGLVGFISLGFAFGWSFFSVFLKVRLSQAIRVSSLGIILVLFLFTFADIIYDYSYIYWPGLLVVGMSFRQEPKSLESA